MRAKPTTLLIISLISCVSHKSPCAKFRKGHFIFHSSDKRLPEVLIDRNDSFQIETITKTGQKSKWEINWVGDCEYDVTYIEQDKNKGDTTTIFLKTMNFKIIKADEKFYIFSLKIPIKKNAFIDTVWKL